MVFFLADKCSHQLMDVEEGFKPQSVSAYPAAIT
jgi:hypothetical protein